MLKVSQYHIHPHACRLCNNPRLPAIDTLQDEETDVSNVRIYVCAPCAVRMAKMVASDMGVTIVDAAVFAELEERVAAADKHLAESNERAAYFRATLEGIAEATKAQFGVTIDEAIVQAETLAHEAVEG